VRVVLVTDVSNKEYLGAALIDAVSGTGESASDAVSGFEMPHPRGSGAWMLLSPRARTTRLRLEQYDLHLSEFAGVFQGIRTGANDLFILRLESTDGPLAQIVNGLGDPAILESSLLHPVAFGSEIQRYAVVGADRWLLYPYRRGVLIPELELRESFPNTYRYLLRYQDSLSSRSSIIAGKLHWYELVRKRDEAWLSSRKLVTRDLATRTSFALDTDGQVFLVGGTAVVPDPLSALPLLAYLNSSIANEYLIEMTPTFRGAFRKFEPQHLTQLPVPSFLADLDDTAMQLGELAWEVLQATAMNQFERGKTAEDEIDRILAEAVGIE
jgi:hypothetical protein